MDSFLPEGLPVICINIDICIDSTLLLTKFAHRKLKIRQVFSCQCGPQALAAAQAIAARLSAQAPAPTPTPNPSNEWADQPDYYQPSPTAALATAQAIADRLAAQAATAAPDTAEAVPTPTPPQTSARDWYEETPLPHAAAAAVSSAAASQAQAIADRLAAQSAGQAPQSLMPPGAHQQTGLWQPGVGAAPQPVSAAAAAAQAIADRLAAQAGPVAGGLPYNGNMAGQTAGAASHLPPEAAKRKKWDSQ